MNGYLTAPEAARILKVHINTIHKWIHQGTLRAYKVQGRGRWRIKTDDLEALFKEEK